MMRPGLKVLAVLAICTNLDVVRVGLTQSTPEENSLVARSRIADGEKVFQATCSSQYCHGQQGAGGQGPQLSDHPMSPEYVTATVRNGRPGTNMAPFEDVLSPMQISAVVAYVLSLSPRATPAASAVTPIKSSAPSTQAVSVGQEKGTPAAGADVFFDATSLSSCRACHTYDQRGGPLGVDLAEVKETPEQVFAIITHADVATRNYPVISITMSSGEKLTGIQANETADTLQVFDVVIPPVRRTFRKSQISSVVVSGKAIFDHRKLGLTHQQQLDVASLLGSRQP